MEKKPNISYFHVFGCVCFIFNQKDQRLNFKAKVDEGFFLGYSNESKAFRLFNVYSQIIEESIHMIFNVDSYTNDPTDHPTSMLDELTQYTFANFKLIEPMISLT